jgi:glycosyltransferase involved in cell wall biosynthesis
MFELAEQLARQGCLDTIHTGYPLGRMPETLQKHARTYPWILTGLALSRKAPGKHRWKNEVDWLATRHFDGLVAQRISPKANIHIGMSGSSIRSFREAKRKGIKTICERGSSHIVFQNDILREEFDIWGLPYAGIDQRTITQELEEYAACDYIAVPSGFAAKTFLEKGAPAEKLLRNPYGVDLSLFRPIRKEDTVFRIIYVGAISVRKGIGYLLKMMDLLREMRCELWIVGAIQPDGEMFAHVSDDRIKFLGPQPRTELYKYYSQASLFVTASVEEGLSLVQAQAMACGLPVLATPNTGAEDLFSNGIEGFIVPIRSPETMAERVETLFKNAGLLREMKQAAVKRVRMIGGWASYGAKAIANYKSVLEAAPTS